ncbi:MAG: proprotein convertase P-domain-containing protein [Ignavibacteria bacterium]|nr:proprotein convertase P-domain-containing protein [Ignavibacteria bacterium]
MKTKLNILILLFCKLAIINLINLQSGEAQYANNFAASFNGTNSYVSVPSHSELNPSTAITLEAWVYPTALPSGSACIIGKNYLTSYYFGIENSGRFVFFPKGGSGNFLRSRVSGVVKANQWTHIAGTYNGTTTSLYINGVLDTSRTGITGSVGSNFENLFIGCDRQSGSPAYFFNGRLDNVRIWSSARTSAELLGNMFIPLNMYQLSGAYSYLAASYQFDNSAVDNSGPTQNDGTGTNITYINYSNKAVNHMDYNNSLVLNGSSYCSHYNIGDPVSAISAITLECWIKRDTVTNYTTDQYIINKSSSLGSHAYSLQLYNSGALLFTINNGNGVVFTPPLITNAQWTHVAATYSSLTGNAAIYVNGVLKGSGSFSGNHFINNSSNDSLYMGGKAGASNSANLFRGQIDEVRIWRKSRTQKEINDFMYKHPRYPADLQDSLIIFDFDNLHSGFKIGSTNYNYGLRYINLASISSAHANNTRLSSPMLTDNDSTFYNSSYTSSVRRFFVPDDYPVGITDSILISGIGTVSNLKVFVLMSHTYTSDMKLYLTSPSGTTIELLNANGGNSNDVMTIFSDNADSIASSGFGALPPLGISAPFSPSIKPNQSLSSFNGENRNGWWKLRCVDDAGADIGYVHGWGINLLSYKTLHVKALIQGFYDAGSNKMKRDTARMYFRIPLPPHPIVDSSIAVLDSNGNASFTFNKVNNGYRVFKHRNSIETWSATPVPFTGDTSSYNFTTSASQAFGSNQIQVDTSPIVFAIYGGDVDQDGSVDATDVSLVDNDAANYVSGYLVTDLTGDNFVDGTDFAIADNNAANFVGLIRP